MKIQCNVCESAEASVMCCADEAALCWACDEEVHAANKLASKHQRVPLSTSSSHKQPKCDICQEMSGFFFCLEDRALLCRKCDVAIHSANAFVSAHQRFLLTGVKVDLDAADPGALSSSGKSPSGEKTPEARSRSAPAQGNQTSMALTSTQHEVLPSHVNNGVGDFQDATMSFSGGSVGGSIPQWQIDELLGLPFNQYYGLHHGYTENGSSKADSGKQGDSDSSEMVRSTDEEMDDEQRLGRVPDSSWAVPQIPSPPTASGLFWPKMLESNAVFVPDVSCPTVQNPHLRQTHGGHNTKRRRMQF